MKQEYIVREYDNGAREVICTEYMFEVGANRKVTYNTGDIVYFLNDRVVAIVSHDMNGAHFPLGEKADTLAIDSVVFPTRTQQAMEYERRKQVISNLKKDPHYYDALCAHYMRCVKCNGTGVKDPAIINKLHNELKAARGQPTHEVANWESEGGATAPEHPACECGGVPPVITEAIVKKFFDLPDERKVLVERKVQKKNVASKV